MIAYCPQKIFIDLSVESSPITQTLLQKLPHIPVEYISESPKIIQDIRLSKDPVTQGKKILWITKNTGKLIKRCGAATSSMHNMVCCNYFILDFSFNCHFECVYCFLQEYTNFPMMIVYANIDDMFTSLSELFQTVPSDHIRIGTGENADSLALDSLTQFSTHLIPFFAEQKKAFLELKTKSDQIDNLLTVDPKGKTVVAWSISPSTYANEYDLKTASVKERFAAARKCQAAGYHIAFHLDPLIYEPTWKEDYKALVDQIYEQFDPIWISLGGLRFNANLKSIIQRRFPQTRLTTGEFVTTADGKKRYLREIREELYKTVSGWIQSHQTPTYLCMESQTVWKNTFGFIPENELVLEKSILRRKT